MGDMLGSLFGGESNGEAEQRAALQRVGEGLRTYRPEAYQSRLNALSNISTAYQPANNMLETMYGIPPQQQAGNPQGMWSGGFLQGLLRPPGDQVSGYQGLQSKEKK